MKTRSERFHELLASISDEELAAIDAKLDDPNNAPRNVEWLDDPDPFGMDWQWAEPPAQETAPSVPQPARTTSDAPTALPFSYSPERRSRLRWLRYAAGGALAASLLIGLGIFIASKLPHGGTEVLVASAAAKYGPLRGNERERRIEMRSDLGGFVTLIVLAPDQRSAEVLPGPGGDDIPLEASVPKEYGPLPTATARVLFVVTETPAAEPIRKALRGRPFAPEQADELQALIRATLEGKGYRRMAFGSTTFNQPPKE